jgi:hypothetical protein
MAYWLKQSHHNLWCPPVYHYISINQALLCFASAPCQALSQSPLLSLIFYYCISACLYVFRFSMYFWSP